MKIFSQNNSYLPKLNLISSFIKLKDWHVLFTQHLFQVPVKTLAWKKKMSGKKWHVLTSLIRSYALVHAHVKTHKLIVTNLQASCNKSVINPLQDVFALLVPSCCDKLLTSCSLSTCNKVDDDCRSIGRCHLDVTSSVLTAWWQQARNNVLPVQTISTCWNKLVASLLSSSTLLQVDNNLCRLVNNCMGTSSANTSC